jgi:HSP20 family molecular chaperone IbpA
MARYGEHMIDPRYHIPLREVLDRLFTEALVPHGPRSTGAQAAQVPPVNVYETDADLVVVMPLPGLSPNDIEIELLGVQLSVRTPSRGGVVHQDERTEERHTRHDVEEGVAVDYPGATVPHHHHAAVAHAPGMGQLGRHVYQREFQIGPYARTIELPYAVEADRVQTSYEHGLLALRFPRPESQTPRRIGIQSA